MTVPTGMVIMKLNASKSTNMTAPLRMNLKRSRACAVVRPVAMKYAPETRLPIVNKAAKEIAPAADAAQAARSVAGTNEMKRLDAIALHLKAPSHLPSIRGKANTECTANLLLTSIVCISLFLMLTLSLSLASEIAPADRRSAYADMSRETKAMQDDDTANPGMLAVFDGEALWNRKVGAASRSCADCHGDATQSMKGVAARYPAFDPPSSRPLDLEERINLERTERQKAPPLRYESDELLALSAYVARQSRGQPIAPPHDERLDPFAAAGRDFFHKRQGQLNLSCALCHDDNWGKRLAGNIVPQGHPTGYPLYRLEWQTLGSLERRLRSCLTVPELVALELYLMSRARGMPMETPAVRP